VPKADAAPGKSALPVHIAEPVVAQYLTDNLPAPSMPKKPQNNGLIKRLWDIMFGENIGKKQTKAVFDPQRPEAFKPKFSQNNSRRQSKAPVSDFYKKAAPGADAPVSRNHQKNFSRKDNRDRDGYRAKKSINNSNPTVEKIVENSLNAQKNFETPKPIVVEAHPDIIAPDIAAPDIIVSAAQPKSELPLTAPAQPAADYQSSYKGLSSNKPLKQVTTKKSD